MSWVSSHRPDVGVAGLGDAATPLLAAAGALARDEADEGHELPGMLEAVEVADLGDEDDGGEGVDAAQAAELRDRRLVGLALGGGSELLIEDLEPRERALEASEVLDEDGLRSGLVEALLTQPGPARQRPVLALREDAAVAQQELEEPVALADDVFANVLAAAAEVAQRLFALGGNADRYQFAEANPRSASGPVVPYCLMAGACASPRPRPWRNH